MKVETVEIKMVRLTNSMQSCEWDRNPKQICLAFCIIYFYTQTTSNKIPGLSFWVNSRLRHLNICNHTKTGTSFFTVLKHKSNFKNAVLMCLYQKLPREIWIYCIKVSQASLNTWFFHKPNLFSLLLCSIRMYLHVWLLLAQGGWWERLKGVYETVSQRRMLPCSSCPNKRAIYYIQHDPLITHK